jgi:hypothetical protein
MPVWNMEREHVLDFEEGRKVQDDPEHIGSDWSAVTDLYVEDCSAGKVIGSAATSGIVRKGVDAEGIISIDHGALRIGYMDRIGWGRHGIAYGPYRRESGLAFSALLLNGHNASQTQINFATTVRAHVRFYSMSIVRELLDRIPRRFIPGKVFKRLHENSIRHKLKPLKDNLLVGWCPSEVFSGPNQSEAAFLMRTAEVENGELRVCIGKEFTPAVRGVQNVPLYYIVVLREKGAAYYLAAPSGTNDMGIYPSIRPLGIEPFNEAPELYAGIHQGLLGELKWRVDTRAYGVQIKQIAEWSAWYGTAQAADLLYGTGSLDRTHGETGGGWSLYGGGFSRTRDGAISTGEGNVAIMKPATPSGLVHVILDAGAAPAPAGVVWRAKDNNNYWCFEVGPRGCRIHKVEEGRRKEIAANPSVRLRQNAIHAIQIVDDGKIFTICVNGVPVLAESYEDGCLAEAVGAGIYAESKGVRFNSFEAHPRLISLPPALDIGAPWLPSDADVVVADAFAGEAGELEGWMTDIGGKTWQKTCGKGLFELAGKDGVRVKADVQNPAPGRTAYTVEWDDETYADLEVEITPPGTERGQKEKGRGGFILSQDQDNFIIVSMYLDDWHIGQSISSFFRQDGEEDLYKAVWTCTGRRLHWGVPCKLRIVFDGNNYAAYIDDELVLYRALTDVDKNFKPISIKRVGIVANWEFGTDTGSVFRNFVAKTSSQKR